MKVEYIYDDHTRQLLDFVESRMHLYIIDHYGRNDYKQVVEKDYRIAKFKEREKAIKDRAIPKIVITPETQEEKAQIEELLKANIKAI